VVHGNATAEPAVGRVLGAEPIEFACRPDAVDGGVEPEGQQDAGIDVRVPGPAFGGLDAVVKVGEVESLCEVPDGARGVVGREHLVERERLRGDTIAGGAAESGCGSVGHGNHKVATGKTSGYAHTHQSHERNQRFTGSELIVRPQKGGSVTEAEWLTCNEPEAMLEFCQHNAWNARRTRLLAVACCRLVWDSLTEWDRDAVEVSER